MSRVLQIHPANPQPRLIARAVEQLREGAVIVVKGAGGEGDKP